MQFFALVTAALLTLAAATPLDTRGGKEPEVPLCPAGLFSVAQCCATNVLGILGLDCADPGPKAINGAAFKKVCADDGKAPACCVLPILGQCVLANP
ncbi:fungal hydrophobin-domain-containing protein [Favolaschia claudopus]|uniref:Fungal hydrophobin-domain-containing protein n=1 Tax=Favolaschia claudopus TaxID=2862362 RepID=A0AAV9ZW03_9AGAR